MSDPFGDFFSDDNEESDFLEPGEPLTHPQPIPVDDVREGVEPQPAEGGARVEFIPDAVYMGDDGRPIQFGLIEKHFGEDGRLTLVRCYVLRVEFNYTEYIDEDNEDGWGDDVDLF